MQIAVAMAGFSMGEADTLRKAMGKKKIEYLMPFKERFVKGAVDRGYAERSAADMFEMFVPFADYGFNASHACAYGLVAYQTAYLMAHHPVAYMAAILTSVKDDKDRKPYYLYACRAMGIEVLPPDVNGSTHDFAPAGDDDQAIRYGLSAVRNVGDAAVQQVMEARASKGRFESFSDFCRKVDPSVLTKRALESLILAGAFDSLGYRRRALLIGHDKVSGPIVAERKAEAAGQFSLFGGDAEVGQIDESVLAGEEFDKPELLRFEKEMLGSFVSDHPLLEVADDLRAQSTHEIGDLEGADDGELVTAAGIIGGVSRKYTKRGEPYAQFRLEGLSAGVDVVAFPSVYEADPDLIAADRIVLVVGRIDRRGRELQIRANDVRQPILSGIVSPPSGESVVIDLTAAACTDAVLSKMAELLRSRPGSAPGAGPLPLDRGRAAARHGRVPRRSLRADGGARGPAGLRRRPRGTRHLSLPNRTALGMSIVRSVFEVIPAIDVSDGSLTHLTPEGRVSIGAFGGDPFAAAVQMVDAGATWLHVVDMDLAFEGEARNLEVVSAIASLEVRVQAGGGVRTPDEVDALLAAGADRVVLGSAGLTDASSASALLQREGERLIVGIEVGGDGEIRSRGRDPVHLPLMETLGWLAAAQAPMFLVTAVARVGSSIGPDVGALKRVVRAGRPVLAAGGIHSVDDLRALRAAGASGAVVGRAALEGTLDLAEARLALG